MLITQPCSFHLHNDYSLSVCALTQPITQGYIRANKDSKKKNDNDDNYYPHTAQIDGTIGRQVKTHVQTVAFYILQHFWPVEVEQNWDVSIQGLN